MEDPSTATIVAPAKDKSLEQDRRPQKQPPYHVILWDDDDHSYLYVIVMMQKVFGLHASKGFQIAEEVDAHGRAVVLTTTMEHAELKRDQIHSFGKDKLIDLCQGAMFSTIEPAKA